MIAAVIAAFVFQSSMAVDRGDYVINADLVGVGRPVVAIPGGPGFSGRSVWAIGFGLRERCRTYLFDQLGTGKSRMKAGKGSLADAISLDRTIEDLEALRKRAGHTKWTVVGQSWGVIVALTYAAKHPNAIEHLVLTSIPGIGMDGDVLSQNLNRVIPQSVFDKLVEESAREDLTEEQKIESQVMSVMPYYFHGPGYAESLMKDMPPNLFSAPVFMALRRHILNPAAYGPSLPKLRETKFPVTMIQGHQDPCGSAMPYRLKEAYLPQAHVQLLGRCGHFGWIEDSVAFFYALHERLKLPLPRWVEHGFELEHPAQDREAAARKQFGWPFGYVPEMAR
jgi:pimeloyl-ACP methyl ester carboxylesterase